MAILCALFLVMFITLNDMDVGLSVNWHSFGSKKYIVMERKLNWFNAQTVCHAMESRLAHVMSADENSFLIYITNTLGRHSCRWTISPRGYHQLSSQYYETTVWIGGADIHKEGDWRWYNPLTDINFTYWHNGQPNQGSSANCMCYFKFSTTVFKWADEPCTNAYYFVCEKIKEDQGDDNKSLSSGENCMKMCLQNGKQGAGKCMKICL